MGKTRRRGYIFVTWISDHAPRHVHVYRGDGLVLKWDLENWVPIKGIASARILELIEELESEGRL